MPEALQGRATHEGISGVVEVNDAGEEYSLYII